jgi:hypothetical protein
MCRAAAGHEPACPCRFVAITTSSQSPSPWSPRAHGELVIALPDPRLFGSILVAREARAHVRQPGGALLLLGILC